MQPNEIAKILPALPEAVPLRKIASWEEAPAKEAILTAAEYIISRNSDWVFSEEELHEELTEQYPTLTMAQFNKILIQPEVRQARAQRRSLKREHLRDQILDAAPAAVSAIIDLSNNAESEYVKYNAAKAIVDFTNNFDEEPKNTAMPTVNILNVNNSGSWRDRLANKTAPALFNCEEP